MKNPDLPCDLHLHSYYSDGTLSPRELVVRAREKGLAAISITDHDTVSGQGEAQAAGREQGVEVISGIEFNVREEGLDIHVLGYLFEPRDAELRKAARQLEKDRRERLGLMVNKLRKEGIDLDLAEVMREAGKGTVGRMHLARKLLEEGYISRIQEAFTRFLGVDRPGYVPRKTLALSRVVEMVNKAGGVTVWAHPGVNGRNRELLQRLIDCGVAGVEIWHPNHNRETVEYLLREARARGLVCTGGSDYHFAEAMKADIGEMAVPYKSVIDLKKKTRDI
ncbi:MAG: PHP domain-containing protein [Candidatus Krumholzibacteriota bacterium]|nr:PHP domain-containing protein [Candidatus Krumholzibacteriota bacterium]